MSLSIASNSNSRYTQMNSKTVPQGLRFGNNPDATWRENPIRQTQPCMLIPILSIIRILNN